ncbi:hypothetical protein PoHVEF18_002841 [Penicillium ochrochloron]
MTSDDQFFLDYLASIPHDVRRYSLQVADSIDRQVDWAAATIRETLAHQSWLPTAVRPTLRMRDMRSPPRGLTDRVQDWVARNRALTAAIVAFVGTGCVLLYGNKKLNSKRRKARKAGNGSRKEIVVVAGSPHEPMTRAIAADLERRGYIVYVTVSSAEEEHIVQSEHRADIKPLWLDLTTTSNQSELHSSLHELRALITQPQSPLPGMPPHTCQLSGVIIVPSPNYAAGPVATIPASSWADTVNTRLLSPILTAQVFLPLLTLRSNSSSLIFAYPSISSSLSAPFAGPEVTTTRAISGFATSLRQELRLLENGNVDVVELRLGNIDLGPSYRNAQNHIAGTEVLAWSVQQRALYGPQYLNSVEQRPVASAGPAAIRGSPARVLHHAVLDALEPASRNIFGRRAHKKSVLYVGRGARSYSLIGDWMPSGLVGLMMGYRSGQTVGTGSSSSGSENSWERV